MPYKNPEAKKANQKRYYSMSKETILTKSKIRYDNKRDEMVEKQRVYNKENREAINSKMRQRDRTKVNEQQRALRLENPERYLLYGAKARAKRDGLEFNLEISDIEIPDRCPVLGIEIRTDNIEQTASSPSLDRIDSSKGYIKGNIIVVSWRANDLKRDATIDEMQKVFQFYYGLQAGTL